MELLLLKKEESMSQGCPYLFTLEWGGPDMHGSTPSCVLPVDKETYFRVEVGKTVTLYLK